MPSKGSIASNLNLSRNLLELLKTLFCEAEESKGAASECGCNRLR